MKSTAFYTQAYNAEETLRRTIESVLRQTCADFVYYVADNGSTDKTREIVKEYAEKDSRIIPIYVDKNDPHGTWNSSLKMICESNHEYMTTLDADDEYSPDFLEKMVAFIKENDLDVAACGHDFVDAATGKVAGVRKLDESLILKGEAFGQYFPMYHQFMRTVWCKLYRISILRQCDFEHLNKTSYGTDTMFTMEAFCRAGRVGILAKSLHKYYVSPKSTSYAFDPNRIVSDKILFDCAVGFLKSKVGTVSPRNEEFLYHVYFGAIKDTLLVVILAQMPMFEKMQSIEQIFDTEYSVGLFCRNYKSLSDDLNKLRGVVLKFLFIKKECEQLEWAEIAAKTVLVMYGDLLRAMSRDSLKYIIMKMPEMVEYLIQKDYHRVLERLRAWFKRHEADEPALSELEIFAYRSLNKPDVEMFRLFADIRKKRPESSKTLDIDAQICRLTDNYPLTKGISAGLACAFAQTIRQVMEGDLSKAFETFVSVQGVEICDDDAECYLVLGQNLSAVAENADAYIYFKKAWISYLQSCSRTDEARAELLEFGQLFPDDEDFAELRKSMDDMS